MKPHRSLRLALVLLLCGAFMPSALRAAPLNVASDAALVQPVRQAASRFTSRTGIALSVHSVDMARYAAHAIHAPGQPFDVVIVNAGRYAALARQHRVAPGSRTDLARIGIGVGVPAGHPLPDVATAAALRRTLLAAHRVALADPGSDAPSGANALTLFDRLGISGPMKAKAVLVSGPLVVTQLQVGKADLALAESTVLQQAPGVQFAGPLPGALQQPIAFVGGVGARARRPVAARAFLAFLAAELGTSARLREAP
ncbi:MAG: substrate-binding domain-containing protein [Burkholderiales bacterium]|nr:substrate-binding domain-containing protein [Burkholderiales bacterium]MDE2290100.1 substrate-binding domain-containing protein [Burkholderiales bacterium]MDE2608109.1 substrate-binding domain-containing protein [Burkholderiales bacterium]